MNFLNGNFSIIVTSLKQIVVYNKYRLVLTFYGVEVIFLILQDCIFGHINKSSSPKIIDKHPRKEFRLRLNIFSIPYNKTEICNENKSVY